MSVTALGIEKEISNQSNPCLWLELERKSGLDGLGLSWARRSLEIDVILRELWIPFGRRLIKFCIFGVSLTLFFFNRRFYFTAFFLGMIGVLRSARSAGLTPLTSPPKLKLLG